MNTKRYICIKPLMDIPKGSLWVTGLSSTYGTINIISVFSRQGSSAYTIDQNVLNTYFIPFNEITKVLYEA